MPHLPFDRSHIDLQPKESQQQCWLHLIAFDIHVPKNLGAKFPIVCLALWQGDVMCRYSKIWIICAKCPCVEGD